MLIKVSYKKWQNFIMIYHGSLASVILVTTGFVRTVPRNKLFHSCHVVFLAAITGRGVSL